MARIALTLLLLAFAQLGNAAPVSPLPNGNYQNICKQCTVNNNNTLSCLCPAGSKTLLQVLDLDTCPSRVVSWFGGYLHCDNTDVEISDREIRAINVKSNNRRAVFGSSGNKGLPSGDFLSFCSSCRVKGNLLQCECPVTIGSNETTTRAYLSVDRCPGEDITYARGNLICQSDLNYFTFAGRKCRDCKVVDNTLSCNCEKTPCNWSKKDLEKERDRENTELVGFRTCTQEINNCNGLLQCRKCNSNDYRDEFDRPVEGRRFRDKCWYNDEL